MVEMAGNAENDPVWRDYCVQFMQAFYERASTEILEPADHADDADYESYFVGQLQAVREAMVAALDERGSTIAGTSLRLASQVSGEQGAEGLESTVSAARSLAQTGETVLLRSAAIVTLGEVGSEGGRELLVSYTQAEDRQIAAAAKMALAKMNARN